MTRLVLTLLFLLVTAGFARPDALSSCARPGLAATTALDVCREALRSPRLEPRQRAGVLVNLGVAQAAIGRHSDALRSYSLAIRTAPDMAQAWANRARSHAARGDFDAAHADFSAAIERAPRRADLWLARGSLSLRRDDGAAAIPDLNRAIRLDPEVTSAYFNRGLAWRLRGEALEAARDFTVVIGRNPQDAAAHMHRGRARAAAGLPGAKADLDRAVELAPEMARGWYARGFFHLDRGDETAADRDFLRAYELGLDDRWLAERVQSRSR